MTDIYQTIDDLDSDKQSMVAERLEDCATYYRFIAEVCLCQEAFQCQFTRKPTLKLGESVAIYDPPAYRSKLGADQVFGADQAENLNVREIGAIS